MEMNSAKEEAYEKFARTGFAVKGGIYILLGVLAVVAAAGPNGKATGKRGVLLWLDHQPLGPALILLIMIGILGYMLLRFMQALKDTNHQGSGWKGLAIRTFYFMRGIVYLLLLLVSFFIVFPGIKILEKEDAETLNWIIELPAGNIAIALAGVFFAAFGVFEIGRALTGSFQHHIDFTGLSSGKRGVYQAIGVTGYLARGIILGLTGYLLVKAALNAYMDKVPFTAQAFDFLSSILGEFFMGIVAAGLAFYGLFYLIKAKFYKISVP